jgi:hypothetical protein
MYINNVLITTEISKYLSIPWKYDKSICSAVTICVLGCFPQGLDDLIEL